MSDGTARGTYPLADASTNYADGSGFYAGLAAAGSRLLFSADGEFATGTELWSTDGTFAGTERIADFSASSVGSNPEALTIAAGRIFFTAD
ncbi:MAG: hypothetical protein V2I33_23585, partial [Kangiellaceae bacterium]|nr:hypothetical protein [Kangiellaceae bacterium]